ncbi:MAG: TolC family protein [Thermodesulfobacteriota bacterium]
MSRMRCVWLFTAVCLALSFPVYSETPHPEAIRLSLAEAMKNAAAENPEILAAGFRVDKASAGLGQARSGFMPQVDFMEMFNRTTTPMWVFGAKMNQENIALTDFDPTVLNDPGELNNFSSVLALSWPVFAGGKIYNGFKQAEKNLEADTLVYNRTRQEIIARAAVAYVGMMLSQEKLKVVTQSIESANANLKMVQSGFDSGLAVKSDLLRAQVTLADLEQQRLQAESQVRTAQAALNATMGKPVDTPLVLTSPFEKCCQLSGDVDHWIGVALANRHDLKRLNCLEEMARRNVTVSKAGHLPSVRLVGSYDINTEDFHDTADSYTVGAVMNLNLFNGFNTTSGIRGARADVSQIRQMIRSMELAIRVQVQSAFLEAQSASQRIEVARSALNQADEGLRIVKNRYQNGLLNIVSLLDAELANQQAKMSYCAALHDFKAAMAGLELAAGTISENSAYDKDGE